MNPHNVSAKEWTDIYAAGGWRKCGSGPGSKLALNGKLIDFLKWLIADRQLRSLLDVGCGDLQWTAQVIAHVDSYTGIDCVAAVMEDNKKRFPQHHFLVMDVLDHELPTLNYDLLICKDVFHHLVPHCEILLSRIEEAKARYKVIVVPNSPVVAAFRRALVATGWVQEMEYLADEKKVIYGKTDGTFKCISADSL